MLRIGVSLGGTEIAADLVSENRVLGPTIQEPTGLPKPAKELARAIYRLTERLLKKQGLAFQDVESVGVSISETVNKETDCIEYTNNFGFESVPFLKMLKGLFPCPVYGEDDAKAAAWGEYLADIGRCNRSMTAVTLGVGVGGGIILNRGILEGDNRAADKLGHMMIHQDGHPCTCSREGYLGACASATALVSRAREAMERSDESVLWSLCRGDLSEINSRMISEASEKGDSTACEVLDGFMEDLSGGIANIINVLQPEIPCIDGGLSEARGALLTPVKEKTAPKIYSRASQKNTRIRLTEMRNGAGIIEAACLNEQRQRQKC